MKYKFSKYHISTDILNNVGIPNKRIVFSTRTATSILISEDTYQKALNSIFLDETLFNILKEKEFIVDYNEDEYLHIMEQNKKIRDETEFLGMTI